VATLHCPEVKGVTTVIAAAPLSVGSVNNVTNLAVGYSTGKIVIFTIGEFGDIEEAVFSGIYFLLLFL